MRGHLYEALRANWRARRGEWFIFLAVCIFIISFANPWLLLFDLKVLIFLYPIYWIAWLAICWQSKKPSFRLKMYAAFFLISFSILSSLLADALLNSWNTNRKYVIFQDLAVFSFSPICFPAGLIPELLGEGLERLPFFGEGFIRRLETSHGIGIFVIITWAKYCSASFLECWLVFRIIDRFDLVKR